MTYTAKKELTGFQRKKYIYAHRPYPSFLAEDLWLIQQIDGIQKHSKNHSYHSQQKPQLSTRRNLCSIVHMVTKDYSGTLEIPALHSKFGLFVYVKVHSFQMVGFDSFGEMMEMILPSADLVLTFHQTLGHGNQAGN